MYIFLSKNLTKICCKISEPDYCYSCQIPNKLKEEIFGDKWSIKISDLDDNQRNFKEIKMLLDILKTFVRKEYHDLEPEFLEKQRCDNCNTLLNDQGTCPVCDDGEEDYN